MNAKGKHLLILIYVYESLWRLFGFLTAIMSPAVMEMELVMFVVLFSGSLFVFI